MASETKELKKCPSCQFIRNIDEGKKILSFSAGRKSYSWRCFKCLEKRSQASVIKSVMPVKS
jgi:hypothetical protein